MHKKTNSVVPLLALALFAAGLQAPASAQTYTRFDALPNGTYPTEIDSSGRIVGTAIETGNQPASKVFIRNSDGSITLTDAPASDWAGFSGTDNIVGRYPDRAAVEHGYVGPIAGPFSTFDVSGATGTYPNQANSAGVIVGFWTEFRQPSPWLFAERDWDHHESSIPRRGHNAARSHQHLGTDGRFVHGLIGCSAWVPRLKRR